MGLIGKRIALVVISLIIGFVGTWFFVVIVKPPFGLDTTLADYGNTYTILSILSLAVAVGIWLDKFMGTEFLKH